MLKSFCGAFFKKRTSPRPPRLPCLLLIAALAAGLIACTAQPQPSTTQPPTQDTTYDTTQGQSEPDTVVPTQEPTTQPATQPPALSEQVGLPQGIKLTDKRKAAADKTQSLLDGDFGGQSFVIASTNTSLFAPDSQGSLVDKARWYQIKLVEKKYNIKIQTLDIPTENIFGEVSAAVNSGTFLADAVSAPMHIMSLFIENGSLINLRSLPFMSLRSSYYNQDAVKAASGGRIVYTLYDSASIQPEYQWATYYNRDMIKQLGLTDPYDLVNQGQWTLDTYRSYSMKALKDLNGDGKLNSGDVYGHSTASDYDTYVDALLGGTGLHYFKYGQYEKPKMDFNTPQAVNLLAKLTGLFKEDYAYLSTPSPEDALKEFTEGRLLFLSYRLSLSALLADIKPDWGIVPMPKLDEAQEDYYSFTDTSVNGLAVLGGMRNPEMNGMVIEALSAAGEGHVKEEFVNQYMNYYLRSQASVDMLHVILSSPYYDLAYVMGEGLPEVRTASYGIIRNVLNIGNDFEKSYFYSIDPFDKFVGTFFK
ncbi:MAG: ABC transporter substrate-binding protein [Eubacteriales bacterium]